MRKALIAALLGSSILTTPALAVHGVSWDGASMMTAYNDPYAIPIGVPTDVRYGSVNFRFSSVGQVNNGWVQYFTTMYPSDQYDGPFKIRFLPASYYNDDIGPGTECVNLSWDIDNLMGNNADGSLDSGQLQQWQDQHCSDRPDPHLFSSGAKMGLELRLDSVDGGWLVAQWYQVSPMDGGQYNATMFWGTGDAIGPPFAKLVVSKRGGPVATLGDPDYIDASYNYVDPNDGFDVQFSNVFWQMGCDTTDTSYVDTCWTGLTAEFWLDPTTDEGFLDVSPLSTFMGNFVSNIDNSATFLGTFGQFPTLVPPLIYDTGDDTTFVINAADVGYGLTTPQTSISQSWSQDGYSNPNFNFLGAGMQAAGQDF